MTLANSTTGCIHRDTQTGMSWVMVGTPGSAPEQAFLLGWLTSPNHQSYVSGQNFNVLIYMEKETASETELFTGNG